MKETLLTNSLQLKRHPMNIPDEDDQNILLLCPNKNDYDFCQHYMSSNSRSIHNIFKLTFSRHWMKDMRAYFLGN